MTKSRMLVMKKMVVKNMMMVMVMKKMVMMKMMVMMVMNMRMVGKIPRLCHRVASSKTTSVAFRSLKGPHSHLTWGKSLFKA